MVCSMECWDPKKLSILGCFVGGIGRQELGEGYCGSEHGMGNGEAHVVLSGGMSEVDVGVGTLCVYCPENSW